MEHFHCSLKTSQRACLAGPDWFDHLPLVLLGLQTSQRDETDFSAAKTVYCAPLCLPGEFMDSEDLPSREFLDWIQSALRGLTLPPPNHVAPSSARVPAALASAEVSMCLCARTPSFQSLSQLYRGPYRVLSCQDKIFSLEIGSQTDTISIDRLKPVLGPVLSPQPSAAWSTS